MKTRCEIADHLMSNCPDEAIEDHEVIAEALIDGDTDEQILNYAETQRWPETYSWLKVELRDAAKVS